MAGRYIPWFDLCMCPRIVIIPPRADIQTPKSIAARIHKTPRYKWYVHRNVLLGSSNDLSLPKYIQGSLFRKNLFSGRQPPSDAATWSVFLKSHPDDATCRQSAPHSWNFHWFLDSQMSTAYTRSQGLDVIGVENVLRGRAEAALHIG